MFKWSKESSIHTQMQSKELLFDIYIYSFNVSTMFYLSFPSAVLSTCLILLVVVNCCNLIPHLVTDIAICVDKKTLSMVKKLKFIYLYNCDKALSASG